jgi:hypothetical protein
MTALAASCVIPAERRRSVDNLERALWGSSGCDCKEMVLDTADSCSSIDNWAWDPHPRSSHVNFQSEYAVWLPQKVVRETCSKSWLIRVAFVCRSRNRVLIWPDRSMRLSGITLHALTQKSGFSFFSVFGLGTLFIHH